MKVSFTILYAMGRKRGLKCFGDKVEPGQVVTVKRKDNTLVEKRIDQVVDCFRSSGGWTSICTIDKSWKPLQWESGRISCAKPNLSQPPRGPSCVPEPSSIPRDTPEGRVADKAAEERRAAVTVNLRAPLVQDALETS